MVFKLQAEVVRARKNAVGSGKRMKCSSDLVSRLRKTNREQNSQWLGEIPSWKFLKTPALRLSRGGRCRKASETLGWGSGLAVGRKEHTGPKG